MEDKQNKRLTDGDLQLLAHSFEVERFRAAALKRDHPNLPVLVHLEYSIFDMASRALIELRAARQRIAELEAQSHIMAGENAPDNTDNERRGVMILLNAISDFEDELHKRFSSQDDGDA